MANMASWRTVPCLSAALLGLATVAGAQAPAPPAATGSSPAATVPRARVGYLSPGTAPDILRVIAPPPVEGDVRDSADLALFRNTRRLEGTPRWALALRDNQLGAATLLQTFSCALDAAIAPDEAPALMRLLSQAGVDAGLASASAKNAWRRKRPYERVTGPVCLAPADSERLAKASSDYPSGHATAGWMFGRLLAEVAPDRATDILERARKFGESRVVCGVHHLSAVEAGYMTAESVLTALRAMPAFNADLQLAREEVARLRSKSKPDAAVCTADAAVLAERPY
jgi:acid phosphatase (class A)